MPRILQVLLIVVGGYFVCALVGYFLVLGFSPNQHDKQIEAAMTSVFVVGPLGAMVAGIVAVLRSF